MRIRCGTIDAATGTEILQSIDENSTELYYNKNAPMYGKVS
jgi:hypothetical protein